jgi:integrase
MRIYRRNKSGNYWIEINYQAQRFRSSLKTKNKREAEKKARKIVERVEAGGSFYEQEMMSSDIATLLLEYSEELVRRARKQDTIDDCIGTIARCCLDVDAELIKELDTPTIERALGYLSDRSSRTQNKALGHFKAFFSWLVRTGRHDSNPPQFITKLKEIRVREERRALTKEELERLTTSEFIPEYRRVIYRIASYTGLRRSELNSITWEDIDLERKEIYLRAKNSKNSKPATIYLDGITSEMLQQWLIDPWAKHGDDVYEYTMRPIPPVPAMTSFRDDLLHADIAKKNTQGVIDFHSLRVTFASLLALNGVPLALAQKLMRHSTPVLTANIYTRFQPSSKKEAIDGLVDGTVYKSVYKKEA